MFKEIPIGKTNIQIIDGDRGKNYPKKNDLLENGHTLFLNNKNIINNFLDDSFGEYITEEKSNSLRKGKLRRGDIVMSTRGSVGNIGYYSEKVKTENIRINSGMVIIRNEDSNIDTEFLYILLRSNFMKQKYKEYITGSVQNQLPIKDLKRVPIIIPPLNLQKEIKNIVLAIDYKIENNNAIIANLEKQAQAIFKSWFVDFEPFQDGKFKESELGLIPEIFSVIPFENFVSVSSGKRKKNSEKSEENIYPIIGATKITGYTNDYLFDNKVIITGRVGTLGTFQIYNSRIWPSDNTLILSSDYFGYTYFSLNQINFLSLNRGSTQPLVSQKDIKNYKTVFPDTKWLSKFEEIMNPIFDYYWRLEKENKKLAETRDILLPKLMSGELRVEDTVEAE